MEAKTFGDLYKLKEEEENVKTSYYEKYYFITLTKLYYAKFYFFTLFYVISWKFIFLNFLTSYTFLLIYTKLVS